MSTLAYEEYITPEEYLAGERVSLVRHEYIDGRVYAMAGATDAHLTVTGNAFALLRTVARARGCRAYPIEMKVRIESRNRYYYPDALVTCDERDRTPDDFKRFPCVIVEVLSESTAAFDQGNKFLDYLEIETLREYVLVSQDQVKVEVRRPIDRKHWTSEVFLPGDTLRLESLEFQCPVEALYEDVIWETPETVTTTEENDGQAA